MAVIGGNGTLDPGSGAFEQGTVVPLTAIPDTGYRVKAWTGTDQDSASGSDGNVVTMNGDRNVTVEFEPIPPRTFELTASVASGSGILAPASGVYDENAVVTLQAVPDVGFRVLAWQGTRSCLDAIRFNEVTLSAHRFPMWLPLFSIPVGGLLLSLQTVRILINYLHSLKETAE